VLFDEAHSEAWSIRAETVAEMNPRNPGDAGYLKAAAALREHGMRVDPHTSGQLTALALADRDVVVVAHPSDGTWERVTGIGTAVLSAQEIDALESFVRDGGGLVVLAECEQDKYGNNLVGLLERFGVRPMNVTVQDTSQNHKDVVTWVRATLPRQRGKADLLARVSGACFYRSGVLSITIRTPRCWRKRRRPPTRRISHSRLPCSSGSAASWFSLTPICSVTTRSATTTT